MSFISSFLSLFLPLFVTYLFLAPVLVALPLGKGIAGVPVGDSHDSLPFRMERAHLNMVENIGTFTLTLGLAILVGVNPSWVNWIAIIFLIARTAHGIVYAVGLAPIRTMCFAIGIVSTLILAVRTVFTLI